MSEKENGKKILKRMFHRSIRLNFSGSFAVMINTVADGMIISHFLGSRSAGAFGLVLPFLALIGLFGILLRTAAASGAGKCAGRGDTYGAGRLLYLLLCSACAVSLPLMALCTFFREFTLTAMQAGAGHSAEILSDASAYLLGLFPAMPALMTLSVLHPIMQIDGDGGRSPRAVTVGTAVNILVDIASACLLHSGMGGMAAATTLSCWAECIVLLLHFRRENALLRPRRPHSGPASFKYLADSLRSASPIVPGQLTAFISGILLNRLAIQLAGAEALTVLGIGNSLWPILLAAATAVSSTCMLLGSICHGENDSRALNFTMRLGIWYALVPCSAYALLFFMAAGPMAAFCAGPEEAIVSMSSLYLRCLAVSLPFTVFSQLIVSFLVVTSQTLPAMAAAVLDGGAMILLFSALLGKIAGQAGFWPGRTAGALAAALCAFALACFRGFLHDPAPDGTLEDTTIYSMKEAVQISEKVRLLLRSCGFTGRVSSAAALCIEEFSAHILEWGYRNEVVYGADLRVCCRDGILTLRFRDDGRPFDLEHHAEKFAADPEDPAANAGLRIISGMASELRYINLAGANVLLIRIDGDRHAV